MQANRISAGADNFLVHSFMRLALISFCLLAFMASAEGAEASEARQLPFQSLMVLNLNTRRKIYLIRFAFIAANLVGLLASTLYQILFCLSVFYALLGYLAWVFIWEQDDERHPLFGSFVKFYWFVRWIWNGFGARH